MNSLIIRIDGDVLIHLGNDLADEKTPTEEFLGMDDLGGEESADEQPEFHIAVTGLPGDCDTDEVSCIIESAAAALKEIVERTGKKRERDIDE